MRMLSAGLLQCCSMYSFTRYAKHTSGTGAPGPCLPAQMHNALCHWPPSRNKDRNFKQGNRTSLLSSAPFSHPQGAGTQHIQNYYPVFSLIQTSALGKIFPIKENTITAFNTPALGRTTRGKIFHQSELDKARWLHLLSNSWITT